MLGLNLGARPRVELPASTFPNRADAYVCDRCGRDITRHFRAMQSHSWAPMGRETYQCACGREYRTGAKEWDHFGASEKRRRIGQTLGLGILLSAMFSCVGLLVYLLLHFAFGLALGALVTGLVITGLPFTLMQAEFWPSVLASIWRTRISSRVGES